jgi:hypothetical protein
MSDRDDFQTSSSSDRKQEFTDCRDSRSQYKNGDTPIHISQKEAQWIPVDKDPDDPVSP